MIILGIIILYFYEYNNDNYYYNVNPYEDNIYYNNRYNYKEINNIPYCRRTDVETYEKTCKSYTQEKLKDLLESNKFKSILKEKGENLDNWNWQARDRLAGKKQLDESDIKSYDIENMTISKD